MPTTTKAPVVHACVDCRALPELPSAVAYMRGDELAPPPHRPRTPRPAPHGGPRSRRCTTHERAHKRAQRGRAIVARKVVKFRLSAELLLVLWLFQGGACPCGAKRDPNKIPAGVTLDHNHELAAEHDHPDDEGCIGCVTGYLCPACNRDIVGRLTGRRFGNRAAGRAGALVALERLSTHLADPPLARLLRERPELLDAAPAPIGVPA